MRSRRTRRPMRDGHGPAGDASVAAGHSPRSRSSRPLSHRDWFGVGHSPKRRPSGFPVRARRAMALRGPGRAPVHAYSSASRSLVGTCHRRWSCSASVRSCQTCRASWAASRAATAGLRVARSQMTGGSTPDTAAPRRPGRIFELKAYSAASPSSQQPRAPLNQRTRSRGSRRSAATASRASATTIRAARRTAMAGTSGPRARRDVLTARP